MYYRIKCILSIEWDEVMTLGELLTPEVDVACSRLLTGIAMSQVVATEAKVPVEVRDTSSKASCFTF